MNIIDNYEFTKAYVDINDDWIPIPWIKSFHLLIFLSSVIIGNYIGTNYTKDSN